MIIPRLVWSESSTNPQNLNDSSVFTIDTLIYSFHASQNECNWKTKYIIVLLLILLSFILKVYSYVGSDIYYIFFSIFAFSSRDTFIYVLNID